MPRTGARRRRESPVSLPSAERAAGRDARDTGGAELSSEDALRLEGVVLAAREIANLLGNDLTYVVGLLELIEQRDDLPADLRGPICTASRGLISAAGHIRQLEQVRRLAVKLTPLGVSLDLERAAAPDPV